MSNLTPQMLPEPVEPTDPLHDLLCTGAQRLIASAVEAELAVMFARFTDLRLDDGRQAVVHNGFLPERRVQTGIGDISVKVTEGQGAQWQRHTLQQHLATAIPEASYVC